MLQILQGDKPANTPAIRVNILPSSHYRYASGGYCVIQQLLCDVTGESFSALVQELVLDPAQMTQSDFEQPLSPARAAAASVGQRADGQPVAGQWPVYPELAAAGLRLCVSVSFTAPGWVRRCGGDQRNCQRRFDCPSGFGLEQQKHRN